MIINLQYLRFIAAFVVILAHANLALYHVPSSITDLGGVGVDIFFVISGFIMPYIVYGGLRDSNTQSIVSAKDFIKRRIIRVLPLYFLITLAAVALSIVVALKLIPNISVDFVYMFNSSKINFEWFLKSVLFISFDRPPILGIGWTLQNEFIFYAVFTLFLVFRKKDAELYVAGTFFILVLLRELFSLGHRIDAIAHPMFIEFIYGIFLYRLISSKKILNSKVSYLILLGFLPIFFLANEFAGVFGAKQEIFRIIGWGIPSFFLVWAGISLENAIPNNKFLLLLGNSSYSLYLTHGIVAPIFYYLWIFLEVDKSLSPVLSYYTTILLYLGCYIVLCHFIAIACFQYIESPFNNYLKKRFK